MSDFSIGTITPEEAAALKARADEGDSGAREELILKFVPLARFILRKRCKVPPRVFDDAMSAAMVGLVKAVDKWDPKRGKFSQVLTWYIHSELREVFNAFRSPLRIPINTDPGSHTESRWGAIEAARSLKRKTSVGRKGEPTDGTDRIPSIDAGPESVEFADALEAIFARVPERQRAICCCYFGVLGCEPASCREIGELLGISAARVDQILHAALARLAASLGGDGARLEGARPAEIKVRVLAHPAEVVD